MYGISSDMVLVFVYGIGRDKTRHICLVSSIKHFYAQDNWKISNEFDILTKRFSKFMYAYKQLNEALYTTLYGQMNI